MKMKKGCDCDPRVLEHKRGISKMHWLAAPSIRETTALVRISRPVRQPGEPGKPSRQLGGCSYWLERAADQEALGWNGPRERPLPCVPCYARPKWQIFRVTEPK